jgi:hypothetical protein
LRFGIPNNQWKTGRVSPCIYLVVLLALANLIVNTIFFFSFLMVEAHAGVIYAVRSQHLERGWEKS